MIEWTQQITELTQQWSEAQKKLWSNWPSVLDPASTANFDTQWGQVVDAWQQSVHQLLDTQAENLRLWAAGVAATDSPENMIQWAEQLQQMTQQWISGQKQLWDNWFHLIKHVTPNQAPNLNAQPMLKAWQETAKQMFHAQQEWLKIWHIRPPV